MPSNLDARMRCKLSGVCFFLAMITPPFRAYAQPSPEDVIASFKRAGLEAEKPAKMRPKDYGMAPYVCTGLRFLIPSLGADSGGRVFACPNDADRDAIAHYYQDLGRRSAAFFSWVFVKGNVVVQINGDLDDQTSEKYREAIP